MKWWLIVGVFLVIWGIFAVIDLVDYTNQSREYASDNYIQEFYQNRGFADSSQIIDRFIKGGD